MLSRRKEKSAVSVVLDWLFGVRPHSDSDRTAITAAAIECDHAGLCVRQLDGADLSAMAQHLLRLAPADRQARFLRYPTDKAIADYATGLDLSCTVLIGAFDWRNRMIGLAEAHPTDVPHTVEIAVSIDPAFRRRGLGRHLVGRALALAFARGAQSAEFFFAPDNRALARLVVGLGGRFGPDVGQALIHHRRPSSFGSPQANDTKMGKFAHLPILVA
jgi:ribosomal protein S18 acetylase RimI-like enzyme